MWLQGCAKPTLLSTQLPKKRREISREELGVISLSLKPSFSVSVPITTARRTPGLGVGGGVIVEEVVTAPGDGTQSCCEGLYMCADQERVQS